MIFMFIDDVDISAVTNMFADLDPKAITMAFHRAMKRTEQSIMSQSRKVLQKELGLRNQKSMKSRVKTYLRPAASDTEELKFWFGMNDLSPSAFKGTPKKTKGGLMFRGSYYDKSFISIRKGRKVFMKRETDMRYPITKLTIPIPEDMIVKIEDEVVNRMPDIFLRHFETDLRGRSKSSHWASVFDSGQHGSLDKAVTNIMNPGKKAPRGAR